MLSRMNSVLVVGLAMAALLAGTAGVAQAGLIACWPFDEASGVQLADDAVGTHDGTVGSSAGVDANDPVQGVGGKFTTAYSFDGGTVAATADYVKVPSQTDLGGMRKLTLTAWFVLPDVPTVDRYMMYKLGSTSADRSYYLGEGGDAAYLGSRIFIANFRKSTGDIGSVKIGIQGAIDSGDLTLGVWQQLTAVYDGDLHKGWLYLNGKVINNPINPATLNNPKDFVTSANIGASTTQLVLGNHRDLALAWKDGLDDLSIWDEALSAGKVRSLVTTPGVADLGPYNIRVMKQLFDVYDDPEHDLTQTVGSLTWQYAPSLAGHNVGDAWYDGTYYHVQLDGLGTGVETGVPEPSTLLLAAAGLLGLLVYAWRKRK